MKKICVICGNPFQQSHQTILCCSNKCGQIFKQINFDKTLESKLNMPIEIWLREYYLNQFWSFRKICIHLKINIRTLMRYMRQFNIPVRHGSDAIKTQWVNNPARQKAQSEFSKKLPHITGDANPAKRPDVRLKISLSKRGDKNPMYNILGITNPKWKGGKMTCRGKGWNSIRTQVLRRDNNTCQQCGSTNNLEVHHIVTFRNKKNFNSLTNLVTLCKNCHKMQLSHKL